MEALTETTTLQPVIETPKGSNVKYKYDEQSGFFLFEKLLPLGHVFPFNFGFLRNTLAPDGDPLDALVLLEQPVAVGCIVPSTLVGVIEANQSSGSVSKRNDRIICVAEKSQLYEGLHSMQSLERGTIDQIEQFFISYNAAQGRKFEVLGRFGTSHAMQTIRVAEAAYRSHQQELSEESA